MKTSATMAGKLTLLLLIAFAKVSFSQAPNYNVYITNLSYPADSTGKFQFDIWLKRTGSGTLEIANLQFAIQINSSFRGTGTITPSYVVNSSMFTANEKPDQSNQIQYSVNGGNSSTDLIEITARANPGCGTGTIIPNTDFSSI